MSTDDGFKPHLGRPGGDRRADRALGRTLAAAQRAGDVGGRAGARFDGSRIGRGGGVGRVLGQRGPGKRRVIVKARLVRLAGKGMGAARAHMRYIRRDGVTRDGQPGELYAAREDHADDHAFIERASGDRHQFRFIVSAQDGDRYDDLKPFVRRLMAQAEQDLGTRLDWVAADHYNTGHPHSHVIVRSVDERGGDLVIAREYIGSGLRARAEEIVTLDLGPLTQLEIDADRRRDVVAERVTRLDRHLISRADAAHALAPRQLNGRDQGLLVGRLRKLETMGLAYPTVAGSWQIAADLEARLAAVAERGERLAVVEQALRALGREGHPGQRLVFDPGAPAAAVTGKVLGRGIADEHRDTRYLVIDGVDANVHYVDLGSETAAPLPRRGSVIEVRPFDTAIRPSDRIIAAVAAVNGGRYSIDLHLRHDPRATDEFAAAHVRRLEGIRRQSDGVTREPDGTWQVGPDYLATVRTAGRAQASRQPVVVTMLSEEPLETMVGRDAPTWLDRTLVASDGPLPRDAGFGADVRAARQQRMQWLAAEGLADVDQAGFHPAGDLIANLRQRELVRVAGGLETELQRPFVEIPPGHRLGGRLVGSVQMSDGKAALVERARDFTLVPWRPAMERLVGHDVAGIVRRDGISLTVTRGGAVPEID